MQNDDTNDDTNDTPIRFPGRPSKNDALDVPWEEIDQLLVHGEVKVGEDGEGSLWRYPSYRELGEKYGVSHSLIARYSRNHNCLKRREVARRETRKISDTRLIELRAEQLTIGREDAIRCIDRFLLSFEEALIEGRVRCDNPSDYNLMTRLKAFIMGDPDSRHEELGGITLEDIQAAHARLLKTEEEIRRNPAITGMVYPESAMLVAGRFNGDDDDGNGGSDGGSPMLH
ncbi:MAG: hypothetical protein RBU30_24215 [Polyangia bacterium]|jgi:hypothetical protein|nr:hypothetical protein [Polyangia bacterium]